MTERSAFIKALFDDIEGLRPAPKTIRGLSVPAMEELKRLTPEQLRELLRFVAADINGREYRRRQKARARRRR
jgi:hypothetical protein